MTYQQFQLSSLQSHFSMDSYESSLPEEGCDYLPLISSNWSPSCQLSAVGLQGNKATPDILWTCYIKSYISCILNRLFTLSYPYELLLCTEPVINTGILLRIVINYGLMFKRCFKMSHFQYISQTLLIYSNYGLPQFLHRRAHVKQDIIFFSRTHKISEF